MEKNTRMSILTAFGKTHSTPMVNHTLTTLTLNFNITPARQVPTLINAQTRTT